MSEFHPNALVIDGLDVQTLFTNVLDACGNNIHFSEYFFKSHLSRLDNETEKAINRLNSKISDKFNIAIDTIDINSDIRRITQLSNVVGSGQMQEKLLDIRDNLEVIQILFQNISTMVPNVPTVIVNETVNDVSFMKMISSIHLIDFLFLVRKLHQRNSGINYRQMSITTIDSI